MRDDLIPAVQIHDEQAGLFAERYEKISGDPYYDVFSYTRKKMDEVLDEQFADVPRGARLLDVGCGTGHQLAKYVAAGYECSGCEPSSEMLARARAANPGVPLVQATADQLPYPDGSFDVVLSVEVMRYLAEPAPALSEFSRVLAPGGRALVTFAPKYSTSLYPLINKVTGRVKVGRLSKVQQYFHTTDELERLFRRAGFSEVAVIPRFYGPFIYVNRVSRDLASRSLKRWERFDDRIATRGVLPNAANLFVVSARRPE